MILESNEFTKFDEFIFDLKTEHPLTQNAMLALLTYRNTTDNDDYVIIRVGSYYAITKIVDEWEPIEVSEYVQPFDEKKVYPLQKVQKIIDWVY